MGSTLPISLIPHGEHQVLKSRVDSHRLDKLLNLFVQAANVRISLSGPLIHFHSLDASVVFWRTSATE